MLTQEQWKKQLQEIDKRYIEHNNLSQCDTCGNYHDADSVPSSCQTGDGL
jgi:ribosomal protein L32